METTARKKIFIVSSTILDQQAIIKELGHFKEVEFEEFPSFAACLTKIQEQPQLVILDYYSRTDKPGMLNGYQALNRLQELNQEQGVLFISNDNDKGWLEEYKAYREIDFVTKTKFFNKGIISTVKKYLKVA